jgi:hypothetical protein
MTALVKYDEARRALAECHRVDEVKDIRPGISGVYIFRTPNGEVLYVGEARCLRRRLVRHERMHQLPADVVLEIVPCSNHKEVERLLIGELAPSLNWTPANPITCRNPLSFDDAYEALFGDVPWWQPL